MAILRTLACAPLFALAALAVFGCSEREPARTPETLAVEARAGDFLDYYAEVLRLARVHSAAPDSFRAALDALPGSHLTDEEWDAWTAPYQDDPGKLADRLERVIAELSTAPAK
ncbi:MAG: hypothetical protein ACT4PE_05195 [Candidatus Eiseniibacteriota bacterium]